VDEGDLELRRRAYAQFVDMGRAPTADEMAQLLHVTTADVLAGWRRLHDQHALVLDEARTAIRMANPFSAAPTPYRVLADIRWWYANCAWDALGICAALRADGVVETACPDCGDKIRVGVRDERVDDEALWFHCLVPAREWWDDIVFT
jgi:hypothetical protein